MITLITREELEEAYTLAAFKTLRDGRIIVLAWQSHARPENGNVNEYGESSQAALSNPATAWNHGPYKIKVMSRKGDWESGPWQTLAFGFASQAIIRELATGGLEIIWETSPFTSSLTEVWAKNKRRFQCAKLDADANGQWEGHE